ncbi:50S ribosomal protein L34e [Candidatus Woesearchaeota archaeon]|nr:50S ribosomal protein L34e [Candidatus Woesearchaeota archaeon]
MVNPNRTKSRTYRRIPIVTPGGNAVLHYKKRKPSPALCSVCKNVLSGVPRERPFKMRTMTKTAKRPERPYGGMLCSSCLRKSLIAKARS